MPSSQAHGLEYGEEDDGLFGSDEDTNLNSAVPISTAGPSRQIDQHASPQAGPSSIPYPAKASERKAVETDVRKRLDQLMTKKRTMVISEFHDKGVSSLKTFCMSVVKANAYRIWDIGDMEYPEVAPFLNELPQDQLAEIEANSEHIKKDTDWLWEVFLLQDYPLFHERCRERQGEPRDRGWRRMYEKAKKDALERQALAVSRVKERYDQLEQERASKKIVMLDKAPPQRKKSRRGPSSGATIRTTGMNETQHAIAKARQDVSRARLAITHASGQYKPPPPRPKSTQSELFKNPYLHKGPPDIPPAPVPAVSMSFAPRLPRPRARRDAAPAPAQGSDEPDDRPFPGSRPTSQWDADRARLPVHLQGLASRDTAQPTKPFRLPDTPASKFKPIKQPNIPSFEPPKRKATGVIVDFFGDGPAKAPDGLLESLKRSQARAENGGEDAGRRGTTHPAASRTIDGRDPPLGSSPSTSSLAATSTPNSPVVSGGVKRPARDLEDILFTKKKKKPGLATRQV